MQSSAAVKVSHPFDAYDKFTVIAQHKERKLYGNN